MVEEEGARICLEYCEFLWEPIADHKDWYCRKYKKPLSRSLGNTPIQLEYCIFNVNFDYKSIE